MMKLLYAHDHKFYKYKNNYYSNGSFPREVLSRYTAIFTEMKFISRQILLDEEPKNMSLATTEKLEFIEVPNFKSIKTYYKKIEVKKLIENYVREADCIIARLPSSIGSIAIKYAKKHKKPYLIEVVGCVWDSLWNHGSPVAKIIAPFSYLKTRKLIIKSNFTIYITKKFLQSRYPSYGRTCVCPNVSINQVDSKVLDNRIKKIYNKNREDTIVFGLVGSLDVSYKGHETVIKALSLIKDQIPKFRLEFLGKGNSDRWVNLTKKYGIYQYTNFLGTLPSGDAVYNWMDNIDVYLQPSSAEAQGRSIIEAMSRGCPVIASRVGGIVELINHDWLINPGDYVELANKIVKLVNDKDIMQEQALRNFEEAKQYYQENIEIARTMFLNEFKNTITF